MGINNATIMGRLTADPELRTTDSGLSVTSFCVAVDRPMTKDKTDFIDCVAWRQTAEFVTRYFHKGSMIAVQGAIQTRNYDDKNGNKRTAVEIVAGNVSFCGEKKETPTRYDEGMPNFNAKATEDTPYTVIDEDLPF